VHSPLRSSVEADWKLDYCNIAYLSPEEVGRRRAAFDEGKAAVNSRENRSNQ